MCAIFDVSGIPSMSRLHVCVDLSLDLSGRLIEIDLISGCKFFTGVPGRKKCHVAPASGIAPLFFIFVIDVYYAVSVLLGVWLLMILVFPSYSSSLVVASRENILLVLWWGGVQRVYRIQFYILFIYFMRY